MIRIKSILAAVLIIAFSSSLSAQTAKFAIDLKKIDVRQENTPSFPDQLDSRANAPTKKWTAIFIDFEVKFADIKKPKGSLDNGKWLDSMEINWEFLYKPAKAPNQIQNFIRFGRSVKYSNIEEGKQKAVMLIDPKVLKRYFNEGKSIDRELIMRVSFKANGYKQKMLIGKTQYAAAYYMEGKLVKDPSKLIPIFDSDRSKALNGIVRTKAESPFNVVQFDLFNTIAVEEK